MVDFTPARGRDNAPGRCQPQRDQPPALPRQGEVAPRWVSPEKPAQGRNLQSSPQSSILGFGSVRLREQRCVIPPHVGMLCLPLRSPARPEQTEIPTWQSPEISLLIPEGEAETSGTAVPAGNSHLALLSKVVCKSSLDVF